MPKKCLFSNSLIVLLSSFSLLAAAQSSTTTIEHRFTISDGSAQYIAKLQVESCNQEICEGKGTVQLLDKANHHLVQTFHSDNLNFFLTAEQKPTVNVIQLYNEQSPLIFEDFNFDGSEDLAIRNGNESGYGGPSYDVYVFNRTRKQFVLSKELTALAHDNLGMFQTDPKQKRISTFAKSGCCWHQSIEYAVVPKRGLVVMKEFTEDASGADGKYVYVTTRSRTSPAQKRMNTHSKKYTIKTITVNKSCVTTDQ